MVESGEWKEKVAVSNMETTTSHGALTERIQLRRATGSKMKQMRLVGRGTVPQCIMKDEKRLAGFGRVPSRGGANRQGFVSYPREDGRALGGGRRGGENVHVK